MDKKELFDEISRLAYELYEARGGMDGNDIGDWFTAEQIIVQSHSASNPKESVAQQAVSTKKDKAKKSPGAMQAVARKGSETKGKRSVPQRTRKVTDKSERAFSTGTGNQLDKKVGLGSFEEIINFAIEKEKEAAAFYEQLSQEEPYSGTKEIFQEFAWEEKKHQAMLGKFLKDKAMIADYRLERILDLKISDYLVDVRYKKGMDYTEVLRLAMKREEKSVKLYSELAKKTDQEDLIRIFNILSQEEAKHKLGLETLYDAYMAKQGG